MQEQENAQTRYSILVVDPDAEFADMVAQAISDAHGAYSVNVDTNATRALAQVREAQDYICRIDRVATPWDSADIVAYFSEKYGQKKVMYIDGKLAASRRHEGRMRGGSYPVNIGRNSEHRGRRFRGCD